jgi:mannose-1-phosphate guanylyltransferase
MQKVVPRDDIYVLGLEGMQTLFTEQLPGMRPENMILVPERRNTLPHTLWALAEITEHDDEPVLFKSSDQYILDVDGFTESLKGTLEAYQAGPHTFTVLGPKYQTFNSNDGYFLAGSDGAVVKFLEKPTKEAFEESAAGLQVIRSSVLHVVTKDAVAGVLDDINEDWVATAKRILSNPEASSRLEDFLSMPFIDIAPLLSGSNLRAIEVQYEFVDIGRFEEVYELNEKDADGNVVMGKAILERSRGNLVINRTDQPLVVIGRENSVVVQTPEGSLVSSFADSPLVGEIYKTQIHQH